MVPDGILAHGVAGVRSESPDRPPIQPRTPTPMKRNLILLLLLALGLSSISSCLPLAAGAAAGYVAHKEGYRFRNPVTKH